MESNLNIYQIYFREYQKEKLLDGCIPFFNQSDNASQLFETEVMLKLFGQDFVFSQSKIYGILSWRFSEKTKVSFREIQNFVRKNKNSEVFLLNPYPELTYIYDNPWIQGDWVHPGLMDLAQRIFDSSSYKISLKDIKLERNKQVYCNYFLASGIFWQKYMVFLRDIVSTIENNQTLKRLSRRSTSYNYEASFLPFFLERLLPTYLFVHSEIKSASYPYSDDFLLNRYLEVIKEKENTLLRHQRIFRKIPLFSFLKKLIKY